MPMPMNGALGISMDRLGSGTTWIPDAVKLPSRHFMAGSWMLMLHGFAFLQYDSQQGPRGDDQFGSLNWAMLMADRPLGGGHLQFRFMPSLDPWTVGRCGYPLLLQSGETCRGQPNVDRQHPHDFFMELAAAYERPITERLAAFVYAAPAGEPALGPVAFMHRPSAMDDPAAPLGHHWQDATHISYGVVTAGVFTRTVRLEASAFNGREPDESRWNIDLGPLRSVSGRLTLNPTRHWSFTAGYGRLHEPEPSHEDVRRFVASAIYGDSLGPDAQWSATAVLGRNSHEGESSLSGLIESELATRSHTVFGRVDVAQKSAHDLQLSAFPDEQRFTVAAGTLGYVRELSRGLGMTLGVGVRGTVNVLPVALESAYGSRTPLGAMVFLRVRPIPANAMMKMTH